MTSKFKCNTVHVPNLSFSLTMLNLLWTYFILLHCTILHVYCTKLHFYKISFGQSYYIALYLLPIAVPGIRIWIFGICATINLYPNRVRAIFHLSVTDVGSSHVFRVIEQCCFNSVSDSFNG